MASVLLGALGLMPVALAREIIVHPGQPTTLNAGIDHSADWLTLEKDAHLNISDGTVLGKDPWLGVSVDGSTLARGASLSMGSNVRLNGYISGESLSQANIGTGEGNQSVVEGGARFSRDGIVTLDNVLLRESNKQKSNLITEALLLSGNSRTTSTARTSLVGEGTSDALDLLGSASITLNGTSVSSERIGMQALGQSSVLANNIQLTAWEGGAITTGASQTTFNGSSIHIKNQASTMPNLMVQGITGFGLATSGRAAEGNPSLQVNNSRVIVDAGNGQGNAGFVGVAHNGGNGNAVINHSSIEAAGYGAVFSSWAILAPPTRNANAGLTTFTLANSTLTGHTGAALWVQRDSRADIILTGPATQVVSGTGVSLQTDAGSSTQVVVTDSAITGNVVNNGGNTRLTLGDAGSWTGTFTHLSSLNTLRNGGVSLTGNSDVIGTIVNSGTIDLRHKANTSGHILTVGGDYTGNNGNLIFNTALGADNSVTDKLVVKGNTAGTTKVVVKNAGGTGAQTLNGIELIQVSGKSAGEFTQDGRIAAGAYDYTLVRGKGASSQNFYLISDVSANPGPGPNPTPHKNVLRPEGNAYAANLAAANTLFTSSLHDRLGETHYVNSLGQDAVTSLWLRQTGKHTGSRDASGQLKTQGNSYVAQLGGDLAQWTRNGLDRWHLGVSGGYANASSSTESSLSGNKARGKIDGYSVGVYATWVQNDVTKTGVYVDAWAQYNWFNNHVEGDGLSQERYQSSGEIASLESGYTFALGQSSAADNPLGYFITPQAQAIWMGVKADDHLEANGTRVSGEGDGNVQTRLGVRAYMRGRSAGDVVKGRTFEPFVEANWLQNTKAFGSRLNGVAVTQAGTKNVGELKVGVEAQLALSTQAWVNLGQQLGDKGYSATTAMIGIKYSF